MPSHNDNYTVIVPEKPDIALLPPPPLKYVGNEDKPQDCMPPGLVKIDDLTCYFNEFTVGMDKLNADNIENVTSGPCYSQGAILEMWQDFQPLVQAESGGKARSDMITRFVSKMDPKNTYFNEFTVGMRKVNADNYDYLATGPW